MNTETPPQRRVDDFTTIVGTRFTQTADRLRERTAVRDDAEVTDPRPMARIADSLSSIGGYLRDFEYDEATGAIDALIARHPRKTVALSVGTGFVLGATLGRASLLRFAVPTIITPFVQRSWSEMTSADELSEPIDIDEVAHAAAQVHLH